MAHGARWKVNIIRENAGSWPARKGAIVAACGWLLARGFQQYRCASASAGHGVQNGPLTSGIPMTRSRLMPSLALLLGALCLGARAEQIGAVDTAFKLIGPDHKIVVEAYDDPRVQGITCHVSRAKTGGISGALGLAEDKAEASIACRQTGQIAFTQALPQQEEVFNERLSLLFKKLRIVRIVDKKRNTLVYLTYSDRLVDGSPQNSITSVPVDRATPIPLK